MSPIDIKVITGYAVGFVVFPFVFSLVDRWPLAKPRGDRDDLFFAAVVVVFWPVFAIGWLVYTWWCVSSWLGVWVREAVAGFFRRGRAK